MSRLSPSTSPAEAIAALARRSVVVTVVATVVAFGCLAGSAVIVVRAVTEQIAEQVTATVTDEGTHQERRGSRRSRYWAEVRHVELTTEDGETGTVNSDDLQVGDTTQVWQETDSGDLSLDDPSGVGVVDVLLASGLGLAGLLAVAVAVGSARRTARLRTVTLETAPRILLALDEAKLRASPERTEHARWQLPLRVVASDHHRLKVGSDHDLLVTPGEDPVDLSSTLPQQWEGRLLHAGAVMQVVALRTSPTAPWWVTEL